jgi:RNA polymerase sigma-70 factor (ECF subfamily)
MNTDQLLQRVAAGESSAALTLVTRHRDRLRRMVAVRLDRRLAARVDPSDIVQDAITEAYLRLPKFAVERPMAFYPWIRRIAFERLLQMHRRHIAAQRRSVLREDALPLTEESEILLAEKVAGGTVASDRALRSEIRRRVHHAMEQLAIVDREVIALKHLEELKFQEVADVLEVSLATVHSRYYRAIKKLKQLLGTE